jgi:hypothetical protein
MRNFLIGIGALIAPFLVAGIVSAHQQPATQPVPRPVPTVDSGQNVPPGKAWILV